MKIRTGFVSNSSSSSFICSVCETMESGMDASPRDFDMSECVNGHTFCNCHMPDSKMDPDELREIIRKKIENKRWIKEEDRTNLYKELDDTPNDDLEDIYQTNYGDEGVPECKCPICTFTHLKPKDGFLFLKKKYGVSDKDILDSIKISFTGYTEFKTYITEKKTS